MLDFKRFSSDALLAYYQAEAELLHRITPDVPVTTNLMMLENQVNPVDCFKWGKYMDFVSNDHYYLPDGRHLDEMTMSAAIVSGTARKNPWFLMENSTSSVNWRPVNLRKQPGEIIRDALIHVANGADAVCFFQWRQSRAGAEKYHSSMLPHAGENSRLFREVCELGSALEKLRLVQGSRVETARVAAVYDYDSWWAFENGLLTRLFDYRAEFYHWYRAVLDAGVAADVVGKTDRWEQYETVLFPATLLVDPDTAARAQEYVRAGGKLVVTYGSGIADDCDHVYLGGYPGAFRKLLGIRAEEFVAIADGDCVHLENGWTGSIWADEVTGMEPDCEVLTRIDQTARDRGLRGLPIVTRRKVGKGSALYVGTKLDRAAAAEFVRQYVLEEAGTAGQDLAPLRIRRTGERHCFEFIFNRSEEQAVEVTAAGQALYLSLASPKEGGARIEPSGVAVFISDR